jgi:exopolyphosphatase/pppGpp-phosphohydrolase
MMQTGAQYLHELYIKNPHEPSSFTTQSNIEEMKNHILRELLPFPPTKKIPLIYGSSMIIDVMKKVKLPLEDNTDSITHPYKIYSKHLTEFIQQVLPYTFEEREKIYGDVQKGFMWAIDKGFLTAVTIAEYLESPYIIPSNANIAQGIVYTMAE